MQNDLVCFGNYFLGEQATSGFFRFFGMPSQPTCMQPQPQTLALRLIGYGAPPPHLHPNIRLYCRARKYLSSRAQWVNVPKNVVEDLVVASKHSVLSSTETLQTVNGCFSMPRTLVQSLVLVTSIYHRGPINRGTNFKQEYGPETGLTAAHQILRHLYKDLAPISGTLQGRDQFPG